MPQMKIVEKVVDLSYWRIPQFICIEYLKIERNALHHAVKTPSTSISNKSKSKAKLQPVVLNSLCVCM